MGARLWVVSMISVDEDGEGRLMRIEFGSSWHRISGGREISPKKGRTRFSSVGKILDSYDM